MKKRIFVKKFTAVIAMLMLLMSFTSQVSLASSGAIWTSDKDGNVNVNLYQDRMSVFLNGGPQNENGGDNLDNGNYYIKVTTPDGELLGYSNNTINVYDGKFYRINLWDFLLKASDKTQGYDLTTNVGGVYKVWASLDSDFKNSKTDNFKVLEPQSYVPGISLKKTADKDVAQEGDTITYSYEVTNTGNVELTNLTLSDDKLGNITLGNTTLAAGATVTTSATHEVVESDFPGPIKNIATVTGNYGEQAVTATDTAEVTLETNQTPQPSISLDKTADMTVAQVGDTITYSYVVTNTGNVELTNLTLSDDKLGNITLSNTTLAAGATVTTSATHKVVEGDLPGPITNTATVTGNYGEQAVTATDTAEVTLETNQTPQPSISLDKTADMTVAQVGDTITYSYVVTNTGNVELTNLTLSDDKLGNITLSNTTLAPGKTVTASATHKVVENDFPGPIKNIATVTGKYGDQAVTATDSAEVTLKTNPVPTISIDKTADKSVAQVGDTITYSYVVKNIGNVELTNLTLSDDKLGNITLSKTTLAPGESVTASATHKVVESDFPGPIKNIATVTGKYGEQAVTATDSAEVTLKTNPVPKITIVKTADKTTAKEGEEVTYTYTVTNTGEVELTNVTVNDDKLGNINLSGTTLPVGAVVTGTVKYIVKSSDFPGPLVNIAIAKGTYSEDKTVVATDSFEITLTKDPEKKELPVTGGNPGAYFFIGTIVLGLALVMKKSLRY